MHRFHCVGSYMVFYVYVEIYFQLFNTPVILGFSTVSANVE